MVHSPRKGSLQFWPRKRAKRKRARLRTKLLSEQTKPLCFAGYKAAMLTANIIDNRPNSPTKGETIAKAATLLECPPLKIAGIVFYKNKKTALTVLAQNLDKELKRIITLPKKATKKLSEISAEDFDDITLLVHTQPKLSGIGIKKPSLFEIKLGGKLEEKFAFASAHLGKEIRIEELFKPGQQVDVHAITKGKGFQGTVKRYGVALRQHKSEKSRRGPGTLGPWNPSRVLWTVAQPGKMGYHQRTEFNKQLLVIGTKPEEINRKGGFIRYGNIKTTYAILLGSVPGPKKQLIILTQAIRPNKSLPPEPPTIKSFIK